MAQQKSIESFSVLHQDTNRRDEPDEDAGSGEESESDCEDEETEKDSLSKGCDVESVAAGQLEPVKAVDTAPVESDCTSERCSCDKPNHPNLLHKQLKGNRVSKVGPCVLKVILGFRFVRHVNFLAIDYMYITVRALLLIIKFNNFVTLNVQPTQSKTCSSALGCCYHMACSTLSLTSPLNWSHTEAGG